MFESYAQINFSISYLYIYHDIQCMSFTSLIYMRHIPEYELLLTNTLYSLLLLLFQKQYYSAQLIYVMKSVHITDIL